MGGLFGGGKSTTIVNNTPAVPINRQIIPERFDMRAGGSRMVGSIQDKGLADFETTFSGEATTDRADSINRFKDIYGKSQGNIDLLNTSLLDQRIDPTSPHSWDLEKILYLWNLYLSSAPWGDHSLPTFPRLETFANFQE